jgi:hypothetical protein
LPVIPIIGITGDQAVHGYICGIAYHWKAKIGARNMPVTNEAGLCETCRHMRQIVSDRGSVFYLCQLSTTDPRFPKYPRIPVMACAGFVPIRTQ